jgi:hypothetical protein
MSYPFMRNLDASTMQDVTYPIPGAQLSALGTISGSWTSPAFDLEFTSNLSIQVTFSGSNAPNQSMTGSLAVQVTNDIGFGPSTQGPDNLSPLNTTLSGGIGNPSAGGLSNWYTVDTGTINSGSGGSTYFQTLGTFANGGMPARAARVVFTKNAGTMTGAALISVVGQGYRI